ncbi:MAG: bifunctional diguanylate cyclase/phosphodiesterase, partial [Pseudomonadota bacterium]|nr:bifunctional diguanylate cyclase/phosphodiesterase [Pseudomonadota bacterium]
QWRWGDDCAAPVPVPPGVGSRNRAACIVALRTVLERHRPRHRHQPPFTAFVIDCDRFNLVNDAYGYTTGDQLLQAIAQRLRSAAPARRMLLPAGGDEFFLVVEGMEEPAMALAAAQQMVDAFCQPLLVAGQPIYASVSVGVSISPLHGVQPDGVLAAAECALREAKRAGRSTARLHDSHIGMREAARAQALQQLHTAFNGGDLLMHYQPKVRLSDGACVGFEALLRLRTPAGLQGPAALIEAAERSGFISRLGEWVFRQAASQGRSWRAQGLAVPIAVNLSSKQLHDPRFIDFVQQALAQDPTLPQWLQLEITETSLALDHIEFAGRLRRVRQLGFHIQIDDFGTGYSTMSFLAKMPIDTLKIDRSFVAGLPQALESQQTVRAMIGMAHQLGLVVVAEGVETDLQAQWLQREGCDQGQGFAFAPALPPEQAVDFARRGAAAGLRRHAQTASTPAV